MAMGPRELLMFCFPNGCLGVGCVRSTLRLRPQPFATVRNRSREGRMAVPMVSSAKGVTFGCFQRCIATFRVAGVALRDVQTCCRCRRNTSASFSQDALHFSWQAQHFGDLHRHFAWQA